MNIYSTSGSGLIKDGSLIGTHKVDFYDTYVTIEDTGGILTGQKKNTIYYNHLKMFINTFGYSGVGNNLIILSEHHGIEVSIKYRTRINL